MRACSVAPGFPPRWEKFSLTEMEDFTLAAKSANAEGRPSADTPRNLTCGWTTIYERPRRILGREPAIHLIKGAVFVRLRL